MFDPCSAISNEIDLMFLGEVVLFFVGIAIGFGIGIRMALHVRKPDAR